MVVGVDGDTDVSFETSVSLGEFCALSTCSPTPGSMACDVLESGTVVFSFGGIEVAVGALAQPANMIAVRPTIKAITIR
jgi:hypothetical protein